MITLIDYGIGNIRSIEKAFEAVGAEAVRTDRPEDITRAERLVLPGVGAFGACIDEIRRRELEAAILETVATGLPFLGVCVGLQMLFDVSEEQGLHHGLHLLRGRVVRFESQYAPVPATRVAAGEPFSDEPEAPQAPKPLKIPHMGWNTVTPLRDAPLLDGLLPGAFFYFVHSYHARPDDAHDVLATTTYGTVFPAIVQRNNVYGVQFHPEKSQHNGLRILRNFSKL